MAISMALAVLGIMALNVNSFVDTIPGNLLGDIIVLAALVPEALYYILAKRYPPKLPVFFLSALLMGLNLPFLLLIAIIFHAPIWTTDYTLQQFIVLITISLSSGLFYAFWFSGCDKVNGITAGITTAFMPIATVLIAWLFLGESINTMQCVGMLLILSSIFSMTRKTPQPSALNAQH